MLDDVIYTILSTGYQKDVIPILLTNHTYYNNHILWSKIANKRFAKNHTLLMIYTIFNNYERVKFLLNAGANVNLFDINNITAISYAVLALENNKISHKCKNCNIKIVKEICKKNVNLNIYNTNLENAFYLAAKTRKKEILDFLIDYEFTKKESKYDINHKNIENKTLMSVSIEFSMFDLSYELWQQGADINSTDHKNRTFLMAAIIVNEPLDVIKELLDGSADVNIIDDFSSSALTYAIVKKSSDDIIKLLIQYGANINFIDKYNIPILGYLINHNSYPIIKYLYDNKYKIDKKYRSLNMNLAKKIGNKLIEKLIVKMLN